MAAEFSRTLPAAADQLPALLDAIEAWLDEAGVPTGQSAPLMIAFDEVLSNIIKYGGGTIELNISLADGRFTTMIADDGPPFDPLALEAPDTGLDIDDRAIGGLGIHLVREMMDELGYAYENGQNRLTFSKTL
jgi:anti-sigma regulatory factor (Ser/Thr protein kinase)